jgi:hypothetical protein
MGLNLSFDVKNTVSPELQKIKDVTGPNGRRAIGIALLQFWADVIKEAPRPHILTGYTRGSVALHVGGKLKNANAIASHPADQPVIPSTINSAELEGVLSVNSRQASRLHELPANALGPRSLADGGVGPKFVEIKMLRHAANYFKIIAEEFLASQKKADVNMNNPK